MLISLITYLTLHCALVKPSAALVSSYKQTSGIVEVVDNVPFAHVYSHDDQGAINSAYDEMLADAAIAGIANRQAGRVFLRMSPGDDKVLDLLQTGGSPWTGATIKQVGLQDLLTEYGQSIQGLVVWDPKVPATSNIAVSVAGAETAIPIRYDTSPSSLYTQLIQKFPTLVSFVNPNGTSLFTGKGRIPGTNVVSSGSAKCDAYLWLINKYITSGRVGNSCIAMVPDAYDYFAAKTRLNLRVTWAAPEVLARIVETAGVAIDLVADKNWKPIDDPKQPVGTDRQTFRSVLLACHKNRKGDLGQALGFVPWRKYTGSNDQAVVHFENPTILLLTGYDLYAGGLGNASFSTKDNLGDYTYSQTKPTIKSLQAQGWLNSKKQVKSGLRFCAVYGGDYDGDWMEAHLLPFWNDPRRGEVPITWGVNPQLSLDAPRVYDWLRRNASSNDYFMMGDSGPGYVNVRNFVATRTSGLPDSFQKWDAHCKYWVDKSDCDMCFLIDGAAGAISGNTLKAYASRFKSGILTAQRYSQTMVSGVPLVHMGGGISPSSSPQEGANGFLDGTIPKGKSLFKVQRFILWSPSHVAEMAKIVKDSNSKARFVDLYTYMLLLKCALTNGYFK